MSTATTQEVKLYCRKYPNLYMLNPVIIWINVQGTEQQQWRCKHCGLFHTVTPLSKVPR
jgi:hypothetical protein